MVSNENDDSIEKVSSKHAIIIRNPKNENIFFQIQLKNN